MGRRLFIDFDASSILDHERGSVDRWVQGGWGVWFIEDAVLEMQRGKGGREREKILYVGRCSLYYTNTWLHFERNELRWSIFKEFKSVHLLCVC